MLSVKVVGLTEGVVKAMLMSKLRAAFMFALVAMLGVGTVTFATFASGFANGDLPAKQTPIQKKPAATQNKNPTPRKAEQADKRFKRLQGEWRIVESSARRQRSKSRQGHTHYDCERCVPDPQPEDGRS